MGVVYKLKQEVIDFIVLKKKEDPSLSCRKLVDIITVDFGLNVSKSSVNAVIKQFNLSNPVGRQPIYKAPKNFSIPRETKELLLANVVPFLPPKEAEGVKQDEDRIEPAPVVVETAQEIIFEPIHNEGGIPGGGPVETKPDLIESAKPAEPPVLISEAHEETQQDTGAEEKPMVLSLPPDPLLGEQKEGLEPHSLKIELLRSDEDETGSAQGVWSHETSLKQEGLGLFLLLAALWDTETGPGLGEILAKHLGVKPEAQVLSKLEVAAAIYVVLREERGSVILDGIEGLLQAFGIDQKVLAEWLQTLEEANSDPVMERELRSYLATQLTMVGHVQVTTEDGLVFYLDPSQAVCDKNREGVNTIPGFMYTTVEKAVDAFVTNSVPVVIGNFRSGDLEGLLEFCNAMDGLPGKSIQEIALLGLKGEKVFTASNLFPVRKAFVLGVDLSQEQLRSFEADVLDNSRLYHDLFFGKEYSYFDGRIALNKEKSIRTILCQDSQFNKNIVILTNTKLATEEVLNLYSIKIYEKTTVIDLGNEINFNVFEGYDTLNFNDYKISTPLTYYFRNIITNFVKYINLKTTKNELIDILIILKHLNTVRASLQENELGIFVRFFPSENYAYLQQLDRIVAFLGSRAITNHIGQRIFFSVSSPK
jgi:hypothetical protein